MPLLLSCLFCSLYNGKQWPVLLQVSFLVFLLFLVKRSLFVLSFHVRMLGIGTARASTEMSQLPCTQTSQIEAAYRYSYNLWDVHWSVQAMIPALQFTSRTIRCSVQLGCQQLSQLRQENSNSDFTKQGFTAEGARLLRATWTHLGTDRAEVLFYSYCIITGFSVCKDYVYVESGN